MTLIGTVSSLAIFSGTPTSFTPRYGSGEITERAQNLAKNLIGRDLESHISAHRRLIHPKEMGTLFKALSLFPKQASCPPGFE